MPVQVAILGGFVSGALAGAFGALLAYAFNPSQVILYSFLCALAISLLSWRAIQNRY